MIPSTKGFLDSNFDIIEQPSQTYRIDMEKKRAIGYIDEQGAIVQAIFKILNTERYKFLIYSPNYGVETVDLYGEPASYVCPELKRRIEDALLYDTRILKVDNFEFQTIRDEIMCLFTVHTIFGDMKASKEVKI